MSFLLDTFENDLDQKFIQKTNKIISKYAKSVDTSEDASELIIAQQNKIDAILTIQNLEYVITLIYHYNMLNNLNSDENYNSEKNPDFLSCFSLSESSDDTENDSDNNKNML